MTALDCRDVSAELLGRYVAGTLEDSAVVVFEGHFVGCARCQSRLRDAVALRKVLRGADATAPTRLLVPVRARWMVPLAAAASIGVLWLVAAPPSPLVRLGGMAEAPPLAVMPVRTDGDSVAAWVGRGLNAYRAGRFAEAALFLGRGDSLQPAPATKYYRGAALLMGDDPRAAVAALESTADSDDAPFAAESRFLMAKAWLRLGRADSALAQLARLTGAGHPLTPVAAALAESVRVARR